jgi:hypothetical protein
MRQRQASDLHDEVVLLLDDLLIRRGAPVDRGGARGVDRAEFSLGRDSVEISDPMLSKQVALLQVAGYVEVEK